MCINCQLGIFISEHKMKFVENVYNTKAKQKTKTIQMWYLIRPKKKPFCNLLVIHKYKTIYIIELWVKACVTYSVKM